MLDSGCRPVSTTMPPSTTCPTTPSTINPASRTKRALRGRTANAAAIAAITLAATTPVNNRLTCSIAACGLETSTKRLSLHAGQSTQPRPEPVSRTNEPVMMMTYNEAKATQAITRYRRKVSQPVSTTGTSSDIISNATQSALCLHIAEDE